MSGGGDIVRGLQAEPFRHDQREGEARLRQWLLHRCGFQFAEHKAETLAQRLQRVQRDHGFVSVEAMADQALTAGDHALQRAIIDAASTNHTYFFREPEVLEAFRRQILPVMAGRDDLRIWSAACSTGDEAFTIAMILADEWGLTAMPRVQILGTDISTAALAMAETGLVPVRQTAHVPPALARRFLRTVDAGQLAVDPALRAACTFRRLNLIQRPWPMRHPFQIIFCRNVLYYFDRAEQIATLGALADATEEGGFLVTSVTEPVRDLLECWRPEGPGIFRKVTA